MQVWTPAQLRTFLAWVEAHRPRLAPIYRLAALTGMRRGEIVGLTWADVDLEGSAITIRRQRRVAEHRVEQVELTKTRAGRRRIDLDPETVAALKSARARQAADRLALGAGYPEGDFVFTRANGQPFHPNTITTTFGELALAAGVPVIRLHDLRHTHVAHLIAAGTHVKVVTDRVGHASSSFTMDRYGHLMDGQQGEAADAVGKMVDGA